MAAAYGGAGALIVHETEPAAYPWSVVVNSWAKENYEIATADKNVDTVPVKAWITTDTAKRLCHETGQDFERFKTAALSKDFRPISLGATMTLTLHNSLRQFVSRNVAAQIEGSDPLLKKEFIIYSAHWDHLGRDPKLRGDQIFNGAVDNASGVASILEIARAFRALKEPPRRSILFLATTGEEGGLLGAKFYATNPLYPLQATLADINIDGVNPWGPTNDIEDISAGHSTLDDLLARAAGRRQRKALPNSQPEKGNFYRADHFEFSKLGVPSLYTRGGMDFVGQPAGFGRGKIDDYYAHHYHQVSDEIDRAWDLTGAAQDVELLFEVGEEVANAEGRPKWKAESEFKARGDALLKAQPSK
jgi:Zn-dependent M28 family amino/carboxypeptidase